MSNPSAMMRAWKQKSHPLRSSPPHVSRTGHATHPAFGARPSRPQPRTNIWARSAPPCPDSNSLCPGRRTKRQALEVPRACSSPYHPRTTFVRPSYSPRTGGVQVLYGLSIVKKGLIQVNTGKYDLTFKNSPQNQNPSMNHHQKGRTAPLPATIRGGSQGSNPPLKNSKPARIESVSKGNQR
jgi:hypothetical protein